jgi:hypothetical protein
MSAYNPDNGLIEKVKSEMKLPYFPVDYFLDEIEELKSKGKYKMARLLLNLAKSKIEFTGEEAGTDEYSKDEILAYINETLFETEFDFDNFYNIEFDKNGEPDNVFWYNLYDVKDIINPGKITVFYTIEKRMMQEGYFRIDGTWAKQIEALVYLINCLELKGFFKRRTIKGDWYDTSNYVWFFKIRYGVDFGEYFDYGELVKIEDKVYIPWLNDYLN